MTSSHTPVDNDSMNVQFQTSAEPHSVQVPGVTGARLPSVREDHPEAHQSPLPALTHSIVTSLSASGLAAAGEDTWTQAMERLKCSRRTGPFTFSQDIIYPRYIKERKCINWVKEIEGRKDKKQRTHRLRGTRFSAWINSLPASIFKGNDPYDVKRWFDTLLHAWDSHETANARNYIREEEIRLGLDVLVELAFEFRSGGMHVRRAELDLVLPASPWTARADNVCVMPLPIDCMEFLEGLPNNHIFSADLVRSCSVVTFVCKWKVQDQRAALRQLIMDLCSGQNQRRAFGFEDSYIFGAVVTGTILAIYASEWIDDQVIIRPTNRDFTLDSFDGFLSCYIFLCKVADCAASNVQKVFDKWQTQDGKKTFQEHCRQESTKRSWRLATPPSAPEQGRKRRKGGGDEATEEMESQDAADTMEMLDEDVDEAPTQMHTVDDEPIPSGGDTLSERNLLSFTDYAHSGHVPGPKSIGIWARETSEKYQPTSKGDNSAAVGNS